MEEVAGPVAYTGCGCTGRNAEEEEDRTQGDGLRSVSFSDSESMHTLSTSYLLISSSTGGRGDWYKCEGDERPGGECTTGSS